MLEVWENPFASALLKIERAKKHIADIEQRLRVSSDSYGPSLHMDLKTGEQFLHYQLSDDTLRSDIALIVGDAIHNLKCALDIAWLESLHGDGFPTKHAKFPVRETRDKLESALTKSGKIPASSALFDLIVNYVKCYEGGDSDIWAIHRLDIDDKHRLLIPMLTVTGIMGVELENEDGTRELFDIISFRSNETYRKPVRLGAKFTDHGQVTFMVKFRQGTPAKGLEVIPTLQRCAAKVEEIVLRLRSMR